jgi:hypothetical protein
MNTSLKSFAGIFSLITLGFIILFNNGITAQVIVDKEGFVSIFDNKTLNGWEGDSTYWSVENGNLVGVVTPATILKRNTFIIWRGGSPADFELKLEYRISTSGNSGINYRSEEIENLPLALRGYQCDIDGMNLFTGQNYEERGRTTLAYHGQKVDIETLDDSISDKPLKDFISRNTWTQRVVTDTLGVVDELITHIKSEDWNECHLIIKGNRLLHYVNGVLMSDVTDNDAKNRKFNGLIGVQVHVGPPMKVEFRNIRIKSVK